MKITHVPSGRNAYWFESTDEYEILHLGCFAETFEKSVEVYSDLLVCLYLENPELWIEFQSIKRWWLNQRRRDHKLSPKATVYEDESYLAFEMASKEEVLDMLKQFWLIKELRCYFWGQDELCIQQKDLLPRLARTQFKELTQYVPSFIRFAAERDVCRSYLRVMFYRNEIEFIEKSLAGLAAKSGVKFLLEASAFKTD